MHLGLREIADWREYGEQDLSRPIAAALAAFFEHGYHGTTIRDVARRAGLSVPGVYHYYESKQALLVGVIDAVMDELLDRSRQALMGAKPDPLRRFDALVENLLRYHMFRRKQAFVAATELRSLTAPNRDAYVSRRDEMDALLLDVIQNGQREGLFDSEHPRDCARAVLTVCVGVASWYRPDGPMTPDELVQRYLTIAHGIVNPSAAPQTDSG